MFEKTRVLLDADLAQLYGVTTKNLNKAVKRNASRFPADFMFQMMETATPSKRQIGFHARTGPAHRGKLSAV